jgi:hypothetical protein
MSSLKYLTTILLLLGLTSFCIPVYAANSTAPIGSIDVVNNSQIAGWAKDNDASGAPLSIHIYIDGVIVKDVAADNPRPDVGAHAFNWKHSPFGAGTHTITVYALGLNSSNQYDGINAVLVNTVLNVGCADITDKNELEWCNMVPSYWINRQKDTALLWNKNIKIGINNSYGGAIRNSHS